MGSCTKADLVGLIQERLGFSRAAAQGTVETVLQIIGDALQSGEKVKISRFGAFAVHYKHARRGRNPQTGGGILIHERRVVSFKVSQILKRRLAELESPVVDPTCVFRSEIRYDSPA